MGASVGVHLLGRETHALRRVGVALERGQVHRVVGERPTLVRFPRVCATDPSSSEWGVVCDLDGTRRRDAAGIATLPVAVVGTRARNARSATLRRREKGRACPAGSDELARLLPGDCRGAREPRRLRRAAGSPLRVGGVADRGKWPGYRVSRSARPAVSGPRIACCRCRRGSASVHHRRAFVTSRTVNRRRSAANIWSPP